MSAENHVTELREAAEGVKTLPSGDQAAAPPQVSNTSPLPVSAKNMIMELRRSADVLMGLTAGALTEESSGLGGW